MDAVYWVALLVGACFVALSLAGGDHGHGADGHGLEGAGHTAGHDGGGGSAGGGLVDLLSLRFLFLFAAFFGLTGLALGLAGTLEPVRALAAAAVGLTVGLGGNVVIRRVGGAHVSGGVVAGDLDGRTARVVLPFGETDRGKVSVVVRGQRLVVPARSLGGGEQFAVGDEVVILQTARGEATVVRLGGDLPAPPERVTDPS